MEFKVGDRVVACSDGTTFDGKPINVTDPGEIGTVTNPNDAGFVDVKFVSGEWALDPMSLELAAPPVTDEELAEVYEILGVNTKTEEV